MKILSAYGKRKVTFLVILGHNFPAKNFVKPEHLEADMLDAVLSGRGASGAEKNIFFAEVNVDVKDSTSFLILC